MTDFIQIHCLTFYPPNNMNRDDMGRPKTATIGGTNRLRISSQCLKRTWRTSDVFQQQLGENLGKRTRIKGSQEIVAQLVAGGVSTEDAKDWALLMVKEFANSEEKDDEKNKSKKASTKQLVHYNVAESEAIDALCERVIKGEVSLKKDRKAAMENGKPLKLDLLSKDQRSVDIAMFGRMLADHADYNTDAAIQVAHAFTVNKVMMEDDFFTAVDDLQTDSETGSAHIDVNGFGSGVYYLYVCINRDLLLRNLGNNEDLVQKALNCLTRAMVETSPSGKQNSFASQSRCGFASVEKGSSQPRSLALAFMKPLRSEDLLAAAVSAFNETRAKIDTAYEINNHSKFFYPLADETLSNADRLENLTALANYVAEPCA